MLTDEDSTPHCPPCPWSSHIWGGYTTWSSFPGKRAQVLYRSEALHYKLWQTKSWLAQIFVHWSNNFIHCPKWNRSCQSTAQVMPVANSLNDIVLNSVNKLLGSLGRGDRAVRPPLALCYHTTFRTGIAPFWLVQSTWHSFVNYDKKICPKFYRTNSEGAH